MLTHHDEPSDRTVPEPQKITFAEDPPAKALCQSASLPACLSVSVCLSFECGISHYIPLHDNLNHRVVLNVRWLGRIHVLLWHIPLISPRMRMADLCILSGRQKQYLSQGVSILK